MLDPVTKGRNLSRTGVEVNSLTTKRQHGIENHPAEEKHEPETEINKTKWNRILSILYPFLKNRNIYIPIQAFRDVFESNCQAKSVAGQIQEKLKVASTIWVQ